MAKLKVVMLCHFSNAFVRSHLKCGCGMIERVVRFVLRKPLKEYDFAQWNSNAIKEFEKFTDEVEWHVISLGDKMLNKEHAFVENGVHYYFFKDEITLFSYYMHKMLRLYNCSFTRNRKFISKKIAEIKPDIIHVIGAENPNYSIAALDIPKEIPHIVQLQTLMLDPDFKKAYPTNLESYEYHAGLERKILENCKYIGTPDDKFRKLVPALTSFRGSIFRIGLALTEPIDFSFEKKEFDFVYFAANISKAVDYAIESFAIAHKAFPTATLDIVGDYAIDYKKKLDERIAELGIQDFVTFEGKQATHDDVIRQIKKSRFALLPLKIDLISGTVRESMANGLPVVTTITPATPKLNEKRESVLLSPIGDHQAMAENMLKLLNDEKYADMIRENAGITASERVNNEQVIRRWIDAYHACIENFKNGTPIPENLLS